MHHTQDPIFLVTEEKPQCQKCETGPGGPKKYSNMMFSNVEMYSTLKKDFKIVYKIFH